MKKTQFEQLSKVTEKVRNCVISIYARLRNFKNHLTSIAICLVWKNFIHIKKKLYKKDKAGKQNKHNKKKKKNIYI